MNSLTLSSVKYKEFRLDEIFEISSVKGKAIENYKDGKTAYVTSSAINNAVTNFVSCSSDVITKSKVISIDPIKGTCFYHDYDFVGRGFSGASINILRHKRLNRFNGLFFCSLIENISKKKASYGYLFSLTRLKSAKILVPVDNFGNIHWDFMQEYIKQEQDKKASNIRKYYIKKLNYLLKEPILGTSSNIYIYIYHKQKFDKKYSKIVYKKFQISDIFQTYFCRNKIQTPTGNYVKKEILKAGKTPRITVKDSFNAVDGFYSCQDKKYRCFENFLSVSFLGAVFYHPYCASLDMKVHALVPIDFKLNEQLAMFFITLIKANTKCYSYGNQLSSTDLAKLNINLPVDENEKLHFEYMQDYISLLQIKKITDVLKRY